MKYLSTFETAEKWGISHRRVSVLCNEGRITGAQRAGSRWIIPENAEKPADARIRSGKYIKKPTEERDISYDEHFFARYCPGSDCRSDEILQGISDRPCAENWLR